MSLYLPLYVEPYYNYFTTLEEESYQIRVKWNSLTESWYMDIKGVNNTVDLKGLRLVGGVDLFYAHAITELGSLYMIDLHEENSDPNYDDIGDRFKLLYIEKGEIL